MMKYERRNPDTNGLKEQMYNPSIGGSFSKSSTSLLGQSEENELTGSVSFAPCTCTDNTDRGTFYVLVVSTS